MQVMERRENDLWFTEYQTPHMRLGLRISKILRHEETPYQRLLVVETEEYGRVLILDGAIQITERDEFAYHEMMAHIPLCAHPNPKAVLVIGGGDGGIVREALRHKTIERVVLVDIDGAVTKASRDFFPSVSSALDAPQVEILHQDALGYVREHEAQFDAIIVDSTDPVDFAAGLFCAPFYRDVHRALREGGVMMAQTESPFAEPRMIPPTYREMRSVFPVVSLCWGAMPTYPTGTWTYMVGSRGPDPRLPLRPAPEGLRYYSTAVHQAAFVLPPYLQEQLSAGTSGG